jgi:hypothetical protein
MVGDYQWIDENKFIQVDSLGNISTIDTRKCSRTIIARVPECCSGGVNSLVCSSDQHWSVWSSGGKIFIRRMTVMANTLEVRSYDDWPYFDDVFGYNGDRLAWIPGKKLWLQLIDSRDMGANSDLVIRDTHGHVLHEQSLNQFLSVAGIAPDDVALLWSRDGWVYEASGIANEKWTLVPRKLQISKGEMIVDLKMSPDGRFLAWLVVRWTNAWDSSAFRIRPFANYYIYVSEQDGSNSRAIVQIPSKGNYYANEDSLRWLPDSQRLSYISSNRLYVVTCDGEHAAQ